MGFLELCRCSGLRGGGWSVGLRMRCLGARSVSRSWRLGMMVEWCTWDGLAWLLSCGVGGYSTVRMERESVTLLEEAPCRICWPPALIATIEAKEKRSSATEIVCRQFLSELMKAIRGATQVLRLAKINKRGNLDKENKYWKKRKCETWNTKHEIQNTKHYMQEGSSSYELGGHTPGSVSPPGSNLIDQPE